MFTGIVTDIGTLKAVEARTDKRLTIETALDMGDVALGASISCDGACLTVVDKGQAGGQGWFAADASVETLERTTLGTWQAGTRINLERALRAGDELGGHMVSGHVDGVGKVKAVRPEGGSLRMTIAVPESLKKFIAPKGSVTINGVSLTVNEVEGAQFGVNIIPHTAEHTTLGDLKPEAQLNIEIDMLVRYVARLLEES